MDDPDEPLPTGFVRYTRADTQKLWSEVDVSAIVDAQQVRALQMALTALTAQRKRKAARR